MPTVYELLEYLNENGAEWLYAHRNAYSIFKNPRLFIIDDKLKIIRLKNAEGLWNLIKNFESGQKSTSSNKNELLLYYAILAKANEPSSFDLGWGKDLADKAAEGSLSFKDLDSEGRDIIENVSFDKLVEITPEGIYVLDAENLYKLAQSMQHNSEKELLYRFCLALLANPKFHREPAAEWHTKAQNELANVIENGLPQSDLQLRALVDQSLFVDNPEQRLQTALKNKHVGSVAVVPEQLRLEASRKLLAHLMKHTSSNQGVNQKQKLRATIEQLEAILQIASKINSTHLTSFSRPQTVKHRGKEWVIKQANDSKNESIVQIEVCMGEYHRLILGTTQPEFGLSRFEGRLSVLSELKDYFPLGCASSHHSSCCFFDNENEKYRGFAAICVAAIVTCENDMHYENVGHSIDLNGKTACIRIDFDRNLFEMTELYHVNFFNHKKIRGLIGQDCDLILCPTPPTLETVGSLPITSDSAYVRSGDALFYVNKTKNTCIKLSVSETQIEIFDSEVRPNSKAAMLSSSQLEAIGRIINHYSQDEQITYVPNIKETEGLKFTSTTLEQLPIIPNLSKFPTQYNPKEFYPFNWPSYGSNLDWLVTDPNFLLEKHIALLKHILLPLDLLFAPIVKKFTIDKILCDQILEKMSQRHALLADACKTLPSFLEFLDNPKLPAIIDRIFMEYKNYVQAGYSSTNIKIFDHPITQAKLLDHSLKKLLRHNYFPNLCKMLNRETLMRGKMLRIDEIYLGLAKKRSRWFQQHPEREMQLATIKNMANQSNQEILIGTLLTVRDRIQKTAYNCGRAGIFNRGSQLKETIDTILNTISYDSKSCVNALNKYLGDTTDHAELKMWCQGVKNSGQIFTCSD